MRDSNAVRFTPCKLVLVFHQLHDQFQGCQHPEIKANSDVEECEIALKEIKIESQCDVEDQNDEEITFLTMLPNDDDLPQLEAKSESPDAEATQTEPPQSDADIDAQLADIIANIKIDVPPNMDAMFNSLLPNLACMEQRRNWLASENNIQMAEYNRMQEANKSQTDATKQLELFIDKGPLAVPNISMEDICNNLLQQEQTKQLVDAKKTKLEERNKEIFELNFQIGQALAQKTTLIDHANACRRRALEFTDKMLKFVDSLG